MGKLSSLVEDDSLDVNSVDANGWTALHHAAAIGDAAAAGLLLECDANPDIPDNEGNTPLHITAQNNKRLVTSCLMWGQAEITCVNKKGNTILHECALSGAK